jgi:arylsulfatase A-like enzyme
VGALLVSARAVRGALGPLGSAIARAALGGVAAAGLAGGLVAAEHLARPEAATERAALYDRSALLSNLVDVARLVRGAWAVPAPPHPPPPAEPAPRPRAPPWPTGEALAGALGGTDVVLVTVDALRADHLGAYGYGRPTSPRIDRLADESVVFERAYAPVPHTSYSIVSLLSGRHAFALTRSGGAERLSTLADAFRDRGYRTLAVYPPAIFFTDGESLSSLERRSLGFEVSDVAFFEEPKDSQERTLRAIRLLDAHRGQPVFLWVHYFGPHEPYVTFVEPGHAGFGKRDVDRYDDEIRSVDRAVGRLIDHVRATRPGTLVVLTADHGEEFGEHGGAYHGTTLYDEQLRVPLIMSLPDVPPRRVRTAVSTIDVAPTVASLVGMPAPAGVEGTDLGPWLLPFGAGPEPPRDPVFAELGGLKMAVLGHRKVLCDFARDFCRLHDFVKDPHERMDVAPRHASEVASLRARILAFTRSGGAAGSAATSVALAADRGGAQVVAAALRGDPEALKRLPAIALGEVAAGPADRRAAARLIARAPRPEHARPLRALARVADDQLGPWAAVGLARLGDGASLRLLRESDFGGSDPELRIERALALGHVGAPEAAAALVDVLPSIRDVNVRCSLFGALARTRGPEALATLMAAYDEIRTRLCVAESLGDLRDPRVVPIIEDKLRGEPYSTVRAALARSLGRTGGFEGIAVLERLFREEIETSVIAAAARALSGLGAATRLPRRRKLVTPPDARELWLVVGSGKAEPRRLVLASRSPRRALAEVDLTVPRDAYGIELPTPLPRALWVPPPATYALFR